MQTSYRRISVVLGFCLLIVLLVLNALVVRRQLNVQLANQAWVSHTQEVLFDLSQTASLIKDAETGQRGFLYTEDRKYLADYLRAIAQIDPQIDELARRTDDNPRQQQSLIQLRTLAHAKQQELAKTIALAQAGRPQDARALVQSDEGLRLMNEIRTQLNAMVQEEISLGNSRSIISQRSVRITFACVYITSLIAVLGLALLAYYIVRERDLRDRYAHQMAAREEWFRSTLTSLGDAVIATDAKGLVTFLNPVAEELMGRSFASSIGRLIDEVFPIFNESTRAVVENPVRKVMEMGRVIGLANHTVLQRLDGTFVPIEDSAAPIRDSNDVLVGVVLVFRDATHERKAQELMRKTEKLAAAARIASTMAHEINNPLEAIGNLLYIAKLTPGLPPAAAEPLLQAEQELDRVSHITRQTLGFYRESKEPDQIELPALIDSVLKIHSNKFHSKNICVSRDFQPCPPVRGLTGELKQVVANLVSNAADAVQQNGTIKVILACVEAGHGRSVRISVADNGSGIATEHMANIFEPFFTTKKDVGTGLGLWVTKEIVERHGGTVEVQSRVNSPNGTVFHILLPLGAELDQETV